jgi:protein SCO1/2
MRLPPLILSLSLALLGCGSAPPAPEPAATVDLDALPGDSLYHLDVALTDQHGQSVPLSLFAGRPVIISMFYASCPSACPMLVADIQRLEAALSPEERAQIRVLLVSLDPAQDTPEALADAVAQYGVDGERWRLTAPPEDQVRTIAAVLGISYQAVQSGELHHSSILTLLDAHGRPTARLDGLRQDPAPLVAALRQM